MTTLAVTVDRPNEVLAPLTFSGTEDTIVATIRLLGRQYRRLQLVCDTVAWQYGYVAGGIAADNYFPVAAGVPFNLDLQMQITSFYVNGTATNKLRILAAN